MPTYKIIGADGKEYGPITADVLKQWIADGRANAQTRVQLEGATEWRALAEFPELAVAAPSLGTPPVSSRPAGSASVAEQVSGPAIGLIVTAILGFIATILGTLWNLFAVGAGMNQPGLNPEMEKFITVFSGTMGVISGIIGFVAAGLILFGALKMKKRTSYGWAMTASILAVVPCVSPCCLVGLPIGIWALVVLSKPEVKSQFT